MAVSKRTRYEVLRRDNHACRYCGGIAPDVKLTVDHVMPKALGGSDDPSNLVAACRDCNFGKASTSPDAATVEQVNEDDIRWAAAVERAAKQMTASLGDEEGQLDWFLEEWREWDKTCSCLPSGWVKSVNCWLNAGLTPELLIDSLNVALSNRNVSHRGVFAYMGGIARKRIERLHEAARQAMREESPDGP